MNKINIFILLSLVTSMYGYSLQGIDDKILMIAYALIILTSTILAYILIYKSKAPKNIYIKLLIYLTIYHIISINISKNLGGVINFISSGILIFIYLKTIYKDIQRHVI